MQNKFTNVKLFTIYMFLSRFEKFIDNKLNYLLFFSGLSPFLDDSLDETNANILRGDFSFPEEYFDRVSKDAKDLIKSILRVNPAQRATSEVALESAWFKTHGQKTARIPTTHLTTFVRRRKKKLNSITPLTANQNSPITESSPSRIKTNFL